MDPAFQRLPRLLGARLRLSGDRADLWVFQWAFNRAFEGGLCSTLHPGGVIALILKHSGSMLTETPGSSASWAIVAVFLALQRRGDSPPSATLVPMPGALLSFDWSDVAEWIDSSD